MSCCVERKITQAYQFLIMSCCVERKITQAYHNIMERICDDVNYILNKLIEKGTLLYTIKDDMDSVSQSNPLAKSDFLLRRILDKNAGHDFLDVLNERGRYGDIFQKIWNQDESREGTFQCECCKQITVKIEDQIGEMRADYERRLQQYQEESKKKLQKYQEESEKRRQQEREEFKKKRKQDREEMLKIIKKHRMDVKRKAINQTLRGKRKSAKRQRAESRSLEISILEAEIASLRKRTEELQRTLLKREHETNDLKEEMTILQKQMDDKESTLTTKRLQKMQLFIMLCAF